MYLTLETSDFFAKLGEIFSAISFGVVFNEIPSIILPSGKVINIFSYGTLDKNSCC